MKYEKSCGAVVYRENGNDVEFLTISHTSDGHWCFPKGHVEEGESEEETAIREIREETGIEVRLINKFKASTKYSPYEGMMKEVIYFLAESKDGEVDIKLDEIKEYKWTSYEDGKEILTYESSKNILEHAYNFILKKKG